MEINNDETKKSKRKPRSRRITRLRRLIEEFLRKEATDIDIEIIWKFIKKILTKKDK